MNITPALPSPYHPSNDQERQTVGPVRASNPSMGATDDERRRHHPPAVDRVERERLIEQAEHGLKRYHHGAESARANRALASYAQIAEDNRRQGLHELLGFDAYA